MCSIPIDPPTELDSVVPDKISVTQDFVLYLLLLIDESDIFGLIIMSIRRPMCLSALSSLAIEFGRY